MENSILIKPHDTPKTYIKLGANAAIKETARIDLCGNVSIGDFFIMSDFAIIFTHKHNIDDINIPITEQGIITNDITIGDDVYIGHNATILGGVTEIKNGCVIGAGAILTKNADIEYGIYIGNPAKFLRKRGEKK